MNVVGDCSVITSQMSSNAVERQSELTSAAAASHPVSADTASCTQRDCPVLELLPLEPTN